MFKSKTSVCLLIVLSVILSSCDFFNTSIPDWFREYTDYPTVSGIVWSGKGKKDSSGVLNASSSEDFTVTLTMNNLQQFKFTPGENMILSFPEELTASKLNTSVIKIKQNSSDLSKIVITYPADFLREAERGTKKFDISPKVVFKHPKIGIDFCTYDSFKVICNSAPTMPSGAVLYKDSSDNKYVICFNLPDKNAMKSGAKDSDIKKLRIDDTDYDIKVNADGTFSFSNPNFLQAPTPALANSNYEKVDSSHDFIPNGQPVYFKTSDSIGSNPVYKIEIFDETIGSGAVTVGASMLRLKEPEVSKKDSHDEFTSLNAAAENEIPVSSDGSSYVYITPPSEYATGGAVQDVSVVYELWRGHNKLEKISDGTVTADQSPVAVPGGKTLLRVYAYKDGAADSSVKEYKLSVLIYAYYVKGEGASVLSGSAEDTNEGTKSYPLKTVHAAIQKINALPSATEQYTVFVDGSAAEDNAITVGGSSGGTSARKIEIKRLDSATAEIHRASAASPAGALFTVEKDSNLKFTNITIDGKNLSLSGNEMVSRGNTVFEGCTVQNYTVETKRVLYVENGNCTISNTVMQGAASLTPQGYVYVNKTAAESPVFTVKGSVKIGGAGDLTSVILGCYEDSSYNWNSAFVNADGLNAGSYINLVPSKYDKQSGKTLVKGSGASSYKDYFHIAGNSDDGGHYLLEAGDDGGINNALILKKSIIISGGDENAWAKLKYNAERANDGEVIVVTGTIKASNSTATINSTSVNNFGDIVITKKVTIRAKDETGAVIDANKKDGGKTAHRIFKADGTGAELTLQNIKLQGGIAEDGHEIAFGGAVYVKGGAALVLDKCVVTDNSAWRGGGIYIAEDSKFEAKNGCKILQNKAVYDTSMSYSGLGGGVSTSKSGEIELSNAELNDNTAEQSGGAICIYGAKSFKIENCTIKQNKAKRYGAGVFCDDNYAPITAEITNSAIENNELDQNLEQDSSGTYGGAGISFTGIGTGRTLTISGGSIKNNKAYKLYGGGIRAGIATVTIKDNVNISGNTAEKGGGVYSIISGTFNMESGTISGNKAVTGGGVFLSGTFNMSGGIISGNEAKKSDTEYGDGGGVYIDGTSGQLNMKGGSLIQPSADKLAGKNDVYIGENKFIQLTGALTSSSNVVANLTSGSYDSDKTLVKWSGAGDMEVYKARFALTENGGTWSLILSTDKKSLILKPKNETKLIDGDNGGTWAQLKNAVEGAEANAEILVKGTIKASLSTDSEIEVSKPVTIKPKGANAVLDADNRCRIFKITGSGKLTLQKDSENKITLKKGEADKGGAVLVETGRVFTAHNVTVEDCKATGSGGGAVYVENAGEFTAYDLNISGCKADGSGGAIFTENNTTVTVSNGKLSSCTAGGNGGAIVNGGALNISSITFESNEAKGSNSYGGAIYSDGTSSVTASGCTFGGTEDTKGNKAQNGGAAAIVGNSENAVVFTSCIFQKNTAAGSHGGAIFAERAITVKGTSSNKTKILSNKIGGASGKGGGIYSSAKLDIECAEISGNTANGNGGGIYADAKSVCTIKDSDIVGNTANGMGGGLFVSSDGTEKGKCTITGGTFKKNEAKGSGGGAIYGFGVLVIKDCTIGGTGLGDGNTASGITGGGGGIFIYKGSCTLTNTTVTGNTISGNAKGAGVFLYSSSSDNPTFTVGGTTKIGSDTDTNAVYVGYSSLYQAVVTADDLKEDGAYINLEPANYPNQKNRELVTGTGAAGYARYFHLTGLPSSDEWSLKPNAGGNALLLRKQEVINGGSGAWKKLKTAVENALSGDVILVKGEIEATNAPGNNGEISVPAGKSVTIQKDGSAAIINADNQSRIFKVTDGAELILDGVKLQNGKATGSGDAGNGGGVYVDGGKLTLINGASITSCSADSNGGGVYIKDNRATFTMSDAATVDTGNDVYLGGTASNNAMITVTGALSNTPAATLTPSNYAEGTVVVKGSSEYTLQNSDIANFPITAQTAPAQDWTTELDSVGNQLKLKKKAGATGNTINGADTDAWTKLKTEVENPSGSAKIMIQGTILATTAHKGEITVLRNVEIVGDTSNPLKPPILDAGSKNRIFKVTGAGAELTLKDLTLKGGNAKGSGDADNGGGIFFDGGSGVFSNCTIESCSSNNFGGAIALKKSAILEIKDNSHIKSCNAKNKGGGLYIVDGAAVSLINSYVEECHVTSNMSLGGGVWLESSISASASSALDLSENSSITLCTAGAHGGAVYMNSNTTLTMEDNAKVTVSTENTDGKNEIYFQGGEIKVKGTLTAGDGQAARITVYNPSDGKQVLTGDTAANCKKFTVTPKGGQNWYVNADGKLTTTEP